MRIILSEDDETPLGPVLHAGLEAFNAPFVGPHGWKPLRLMVFRDGEEAPAGGLLAQRYAAWLHVLLFWLPEDLRRGGVGRDLLRRAEEWARAEGCIGCYLDTLSWQGRPFYEKQGYRLFAELPDSPPGHSRFFMLKRFDGDAHVPA
ncbi:GNAT family N-acetyltransferase [Roseomonas sp. CCTCC AB2023176]|uniref:GNAT family N-acetyltransferase n=1 Tax=Roseomonas sp. CCTCC AB2023176 TaxID=3342640 RepID=UPI0035E39F08